MNPIPNFNFKAPTLANINRYKFIKCIVNFMLTFVPQTPTFINRELVEQGYAVWKEEAA